MKKIKGIDLYFVRKGIMMLFFYLYVLYFVILISYSTVQYGFSDSKEHKPSSSLQGKSNHSPIQRERLKPPVDSSEIQTKKISLTNTSSSSTILDKVIVKDRTKEKLVSNNSESGRRKSSEEFEVKKAELKRTHSEEVRITPCVMKLFKKFTLY